MTYCVCIHPREKHPEGACEAPGCRCQEFRPEPKPVGALL